MQPPRDTGGRAQSFDGTRGLSPGMGALAPLLRYVVKAANIPAPAPAPDYSHVTPTSHTYASRATGRAGAAAAAAAASAQSPPPAPQQASAALTWAKGLQAEFFSSEAEISQLRGVDARLVTAREAEKKADMALAASRRRLQDAQNQIARAKDMREGQAGFTKRLRKAKYDEEMRTADELEKEGARRTEQFAREIHLFRRKHSETVQAVSTLETQSRRHKALDTRRKKILQDLFTGYHAGDAQENAAEHARNHAKEARDQRKEVLVQSMRALSAVTTATKDLESVVRLLQSAMSSNTLDMYSQGTQGIGGFAGQQTYFNMQRASQLAAKANEGMLLAKRLNPQIPLSRTTNIKQSAFGALSLFRDSTFSDMRQRYKLTNQLADARSVYREAAVAKAWQERETDRMRVALKQAEASYSARENALEAERVRLIRVPISA